MKNKFEVCGDVTRIYLNKKNGSIHVAIIDTEDLQKIQQFPNLFHSIWDARAKSYYCKGSKRDFPNNRKSYILHRLVTDCPDGVYVDHINHNTLDNRKENLRFVNHTQNAQNRKLQGNSISGVRGVSWHKTHEKWIASLTLNQKRVHIGYFENLQDAESEIKKARARLMPYSQEAI